MADATPPRRRRWPLVVAAGLVVAILLAAWQLRSEKLARTILDRLGPDLGLELSFEGTPSYTLTPEPTLTLPGFVARQPGAEAPLLTAERLMISLPWDTIRGAESRAITRIELDAPVLDLAALAAWQATRPDGPFEVPTLTQGLAVQDGTVVGEGWTVSRLELTIPSLAAGRPAEGHGRLRFARGEFTTDAQIDVSVAHAGLVTPFDVVATGTLAADGAAAWDLEAAGDLDASTEIVRVENGALVLEGLLDPEGDSGGYELTSDFALQAGDATSLDLTEAALRGDETIPALLFDAHAVLDDRLRIDAGGAMPRWPTGWPTLPPPLDASKPMSFALGYDGAADLSAPLRLRLQRNGTRADVRAVFAEVLAWSDRDDASPLPPIDGVVETPSLQVGAFTLDGVRVEFDDGVPGRSEFDDVETAVESSEADASP